MSSQGGRGWMSSWQILDSTNPSSSPNQMQIYGLVPFVQNYLEKFLKINNKKYVLD
jgi:hypothetical protein